MFWSKYDTEFVGSETTINYIKPLNKKNNLFQRPIQIAFPASPFCVAAPTWEGCFFQGTVVAKAGGERNVPDGSLGGQKEHIFLWVSYTPEKYPKNKGLEASNWWVWVHRYSISPLREYVQVHQSISEHQAKDTYGTLPRTNSFPLKNRRRKMTGTRWKFANFFRD